MTDHLLHYGVKGQQWGVRRKRGSDGRVKGSGAKPSSDFRSTKDLRKRPAHTLSNMQLKKINERMQLESKFSQMNPGRKERGRQRVKAILGTATAGVSMYNLAKSPAGQAAISTGKKVMAASKAARPEKLINQVGRGAYG